MNKILFILAIGITGSAAADWSTSTANPDSTVSETKSFGAQSRERRIVGSYSRTGYSPYSTATQLKLEQMLDPEAQPNPAASVRSIDESAINARISAGITPELFP